jgi:hypothetical protein
MKSTVRYLVTAAVFLVACNGGARLSTEDWRSIAPDQAPWTIKVPPGWNASTGSFDPGPKGMVGEIITTAVANAKFHPGTTAPAPHSRAGASKELGESGSVVLMQRFSLPNEEYSWNPRRGVDLIRRRPSRWHDDAENPGWVSRERKLCLGKECVSVLEWHGPDASSDNIERMELIASSLRLDDQPEGAN